MLVRARVRMGYKRRSLCSVVLYYLPASDFCIVQVCRGTVFKNETLAQYLLLFSNILGPRPHLLHGVWLQKNFGDFWRLFSLTHVQSQHLTKAAIILSYWLMKTSMILPPAVTCLCAAVPSWWKEISLMSFVMRFPSSHGICGSGVRASALQLLLNLCS